METIVLLEAILRDYCPRPAVLNPFKPTEKRWLSALRPAKAAQPYAIVGKVQLIQRNSPTSTRETNPTRSTYWLHFEDVSIRNDRDLPLYVLLSRTDDTVMDDDRAVQRMEASAQPILLDCGPEGQWKGSHMPRIFEQELLVFDPMVFASVAIGKPAAAKPPTAQVLVFAYGAFETYVPPTKSAEQIALEMEALSNRFLQTVMDIDQDELQGDNDLSLEVLQRNARQLFRMFDEDKSDSIDFKEYKQMLAYMKVNLLESKAKRFFQLVDDQNKGYIDEREFVIAMYITSYLRALQKEKKQKEAKSASATQNLSPTDVFHQLDGDRDEMLNTFEYEKALELLGIPISSKRDRKRARAKLPKSSLISLEEFKRAWVELVDVRLELEKRSIGTFSGMVGQKKSKKLTEIMRNALLGEIHREEQEELNAALKAKDEVVRLEKERRAIEQEESRRLFQQQRHAATSTRTKEALRERQDKINRKKERMIKDRQAREERRLLGRAEDEAEKRVIHEREVVQELMMSKMERIIRRKARCGDDVVNLHGRGLKELPYDLYHGRDALASLSSLLILDISRNQLEDLPGTIFTHLFSLQSLDISNNELKGIPEEIGEARDLQLLDARSNKLTTIPAALTKLYELRVLHLAYNRLVTFGDNCDGLRSLEELNLASNALEVLADGIGESLVNIVRLNLRGNPSLKRLPDSLQQLRSLSICDLNACDQKRLGLLPGVCGISNRQVTSDEFCRRVEAAMKSSAGDDNEGKRTWQQRYERLARHYFYEFKHVGHTIVFDASTQRQIGGVNNDVETRLQRQRSERAESAIRECNDFRAQLAAVYRADSDVLVPATEQAHKRRAQHEKTLLGRARRDAQAINADVKDQVEAARRRHEEARQLQRAKFADEMKRLARERLQSKQQRRSQGKSGRKIAAAIEEEGNAPEREN
ncbi:hypothetical protein PF008_g4491 [Phytophthora fragariae]|uniref:EF-hand domain-containing protein n=1 Tax=Phytophthora fragariae TaxID=53985 RepID=A0A6G0SB56_9STRA|nr:hypothetical protein PF008_g4491 [Phytophthora fragariae]